MAKKREEQVKGKKRKASEMTKSDNVWSSTYVHGKKSKVSEMTKSDNVKLSTQEEEEDPPGDGIQTVKDGRVQRKVCMYCRNPFSYSHLIESHLNLNSRICCDAIPKQDISTLVIEQENKDWTSATIAKCEKRTEYRNLYAGKSI